MVIAAGELTRIECPGPFTRTIFRYYQERNMQTAKEALQAGESIASVSGKLGYSSLVHFSYAFKREFGVPPSQYR
ncbi:MAG: helix-turn-helix domain-containing protein [Pseudobacter sp.]|uniref:helix-turn-helix domain-containing protein n=1 Tax=Pseudobacter sp. TaxID=2045420 RepID=UPI003F808EF1